MSKDTKRVLNIEKTESYLRIILAGLPTAIGLLFGQWILTLNYWLFGGFIVSLIVFGIVSYLYLTKKIRTTISTPLFGRFRS